MIKYWNLPKEEEFCDTGKDKLHLVVKTEEKRTRPNFLTALESLGLEEQHHSW
jgi:hypothetical protein